jgi:hypothetical protein
MAGENLLVNRKKNKPLAPTVKTIEYGNEYVFEKLSPNSLNDSSKDTPPPIQNANYEDELQKTK